jgi:hypothetical protein
VDLALVGLALGAEPVPAWDLLLPDYGFTGAKCRGFGAGVLFHDLGFEVVVQRAAKYRGLQNPGSGFTGVQVSGFKVQGSRIRVQGSGFRVQGAWCRVQGSRSTIQS